MSSDIFIPTSKPEDALVGPLHTVTYITADKAGLERMFIEGMDLESSDWSSPSSEEFESLNPYFGFDSSDTWESCSYHRSGDLQNIQVRAMHVGNDKPMTRPEIDGRYFGGATIGFPMKDMPGREEKMNQAGVQSSVGVKELQFTGATGETYSSFEIHFMAAENVFVLGVQRPDIFVQVGPVDPQTNIGAAAYSARCVNDTEMESVNQFCVDVLGYELRRDMAMSVGPRSGLRLEEGMPERFVQAFAPGASSGYLVFLEHGGMGIPSPAPSVGPPNRGLVMWTFPCKDLDEVYQRAQTAGLEILQAPQTRQSPYLPDTRTLIMKDPSGFPIELFES